MQKLRFKMKKRLYTLGVATLLLMICQWGWGQEGRVYVSNNPTGAGVSVRWVGPEISYQEGVNIYRKTGRKDWELLTTTPIMPPTSVPTDVALNSNQQGILEAFIKTDHAAFIEGLAGIFTLVESIKSYPLALAMHIAYDDQTAELGKKYTYKVEPVLNGQPFELGTSEEIKCAKFEPIPAPQNIQAKRKRKISFLWWENNEDLYYSYDVYLKRPTDENYKLIFDEVGAGNLGKATKNFVDFTTHKDSTYFVKLVGSDYFGQPSVMSEPFEVKIADLDPVTPSELTLDVNSKEGIVKISWPPVPESDLAECTLYRMEENVDTAYLRVNRKKMGPGDTSFVDKTGTGVFLYQMEYEDKSGNISKSLVYAAEVHDIAAPTTPQNVYLKADTGKFRIKWDPSPESDLKGYVVMRSVADDDNSDNKYMPASAIIDTNYYEEPMPKNLRSPFVYVIQAVDSQFNHSPYSEEVIGQLPDVVAPVAPFIESVTEQEGILRIEWVDNVEKDLKGYEIYRKKKGDTLDFEKLNGAMVPKSIAAYSDKTAERGQLYEYFVLAIDQSDLVSPQSNIASGKKDFLPLKGQVNITKQRFNAIKKEVNLTWTTDDLENEPIVGCAIFRSINGGRPLQRGKVSDKVQFKEKLTKPGQYQYHVRVYGERGNILHSEPIEIEVKSE